LKTNLTTRQQNQKKLTSRNTEQQDTGSGYRYALRLLAGRDYTRSAILTKMAARDVAPSDAEQVVERLQQEGWLDDRRYAERFAAAAVSSGRFFGARLRQEMSRRGFEPAVVGEVLKEVFAEHDEPTAVRLILQNRYPQFSFSRADDREKRRVVGYLQRRGFGFSAIMQALRSDDE